VSLFVLSLEIEDRDEVEVVTERSTKRLSSLNILFNFQADHKKIQNSLTYIFFLQPSKDVTFMHRYQVAKYVIFDKYFSIQGKFYNN
jgi:hypothetical protein